MRNACFRASKQEHQSVFLVGDFLPFWMWRALLHKMHGKAWGEGWKNGWQLWMFATSADSFCTLRVQQLINSLKPKCTVLKYSCVFSSVKNTSKNAIQKYRRLNLLAYVLMVILTVPQTSVSCHRIWSDAWTDEVWFWGYEFLCPVKSWHMLSYQKWK